MTTMLVVMMMMMMMMIMEVVLVAAVVLPHFCVDVVCRVIVLFQCLMLYGNLTNITKK